MSQRMDHMQYMDGMEQIDSDIMDQVLRARKSYDYNQYTAVDVNRVLKKDRINAEDFGILLSPAAQPFLETMAQKAQKLTREHFGNTVCMFTPLYIANYCENECVYCGFNCKNKIHRAKLTEEEMEREMKAIASTGLKELLILTGESRSQSPVDYIGTSVKIARKYFAPIPICSHGSMLMSFKLNKIDSFSYPIFLTITSIICIISFILLTFIF